MTQKRLDIGRKALNAGYFSMLSSLVLMVIKLFAGWIGNSYALIADGVESATDVLASTLVILGLRYAQKPADSNHPYGHGKIEPLVTFVVVLFLIVSATLIAYQGILNLFQPQEVPQPWTLLILAVIVLWKEFSYRRVIKRANQTNSSALKADAWHHRSDAISSVLAFIGIAVAVIFGQRFAAADDIAAILAACFIMYNSYLIFRPALAEVMDEHLHLEVEENVRQISMEVEGVKGTEKCYVRKTGMWYHIDLHIMVKQDLSVKQGHEVAHRVKDSLLEKIPEIADVHIHVEPYFSAQSRSE